MNKGRAAQCVALPISSHGDVGMSASSLILRLLKQSEGVAAVGLLGLLALSLATCWMLGLPYTQALLAVASPERLLVISGTGDVIEPDDEIVAIEEGQCPRGRRQRW